ncbi:MAG TPA: ADP-ribosylglycohydrolase family protein, partial [Gemmatimonadaceae bacterium]|nr:ADP-ribosylglycohydrolase family protein [Gemmatimonadaceae bacterium]
DRAVALASNGSPSAERVESLGAGWVAEEALAIAVYCALVFQDDFAGGVRLAVNHDGDSDSTGAITGNLLGAALGASAIPHRWVEALELREVIARLADDLVIGYERSEEWWEKYPGC